MTEAAQILDKTTPQPQAPVAAEAQPKEAAPQDSRVASKMEALIRREQTALARENAAKEREKALEEKMKRIEEFEGIKKSNPKKALELLGLSYDELTQAQIEGGDPAALKIKEMEEKFNKYVDSQTVAEQKRAEEAKAKAEAEEKQAIENFKTQIDTYLKDNSNKYELINFENCQELVYEVIDEHYKRTMDEKTGIGKVLSLQEAADKVEEYLSQKYEKAREVNKIKQLWNTMPKKLIQEQTKQQFTPNKPKTLTNNLTSTQTKPRTAPLNDEERVRRAIEYAKSLRPGLA